jgi:predicted transcriptional regulator
MTKDDKIQTVNEKTGEKKEGFFVYVAYPKPKITGNRWMMTFQDSLIEIAKDKEFTSPAKTILFFLMGSLDFENYIHLRQTDIVKELEMQKSHVSTAMKLLVDKGIILKVKEGRTAGYKLNPQYGWKGQVSNRNKEIDRIVNQRVVDMKKYRDATEKPSA